MLIIEALGALQYLKKELISLSDLGQILGIGRAAMSARIQRKNVLKIEEINKLNNYYNVNLAAFVKNNEPKEQTKEEEMKKWFNEMVREEFKKRGL